MSEIQARINQIIEEITQGNFRADSLSGDQNLKEELQISSLQYILLALKLEEEFSVAIITAENIYKVITLDDLYQLTRHNLEATKP